MRYHQRNLTSLVVSIALSACGADAMDARDNPAIIVAPEARNVQRADIYDGHVTYELLDPYPAQPTIDRVQKTLERLGWRLREYDFLNPTHRVANMANWREAEIDGRASTSWSEQWENAKGDVVSYGYTYRSKLRQKIDQSKEPTGPLYVTINYFRAELVRSMAAEIERDRKTVPPTKQAPRVEPPATGPSGRDASLTCSLDPLLQFETHGVEFAQWVRQFVAQIRKNWTGQSLAAIGEATQVVIAFDVDKQGMLSNFEMVARADADEFNQAAMKTLRASSPTVPLPTAYPKQSARITATLRCNPIEQRPN